MPWIKKNLSVVIFAVIALGLLGGAGYFLWDNMQQSEAAATKLQEQTDQLNQLAERKPHPGTDKLDNIGSAQKDAARVTNFLYELKSKHFGMLDVSNRLDPSEFKSRLENTIGALERGATNFSIGLPPQFNFGFSEQRKKVEFNAKSLPLLMSQLEDIDKIAKVLFSARINQVLGFRRSQTPDDPATGGDEYLMNYKLKTNSTVHSISSTYEASFVGFSADLAAVLEGLLKTDGCFIIKTVSSEPFSTSDEQSGEGESSSSIPASVLSRYGGMDPRMAARYGLMGGRGGGMSRYGRPGMGGGGPTPMMAPIQQPAPSKNPGTHIEEVKVKFKLLIEVVKLTKA
jgi:hypothetical protein